MLRNASASPYHSLTHRPVPWRAAGKYLGRYLGPYIRSWKYQGDQFRSIRALVMLLCLWLSRLLSVHNRDALKSHQLIGMFQRVSTFAATQPRYKISDQESFAIFCNLTRCLLCCYGEACSSPARASDEPGWKASS